MKSHSQTQELKSQLLDAKNIAVFGHRNVDGDALWSCLALGTVLENLGKKVSYYTTETPSSSFDFLEWTKKFKTNFDYHPHYDLLIFLDTADPTQLLREIWEWHEEYFAKMNTVVIDHHYTNTKYAKFNIVDDTASSACELLAELLYECDPEWIDDQVATYLFLWLSTDTGHFIYEQDSSRTFTIAAYLMDQWAAKKDIISKLYRSASMKSIKFLGKLSERITKKENVIYSYYRHSELAEYGIDKEKADSILGILTRIDHDGVFALVKIHDHESPPFLKASLRSKSWINVAEVAARFGGWGHKAAAGLKTEIGENWEKELERFVGELNT